MAAVSITISALSAFFTFMVLPIMTLTPLAAYLSWRALKKARQQQAMCGSGPVWAAALAIGVVVWTFAFQIHQFGQYRA